MPLKDFSPGHPTLGPAGVLQRNIFGVVQSAPHPACLSNHLLPSAQRRDTLLVAAKQRSAAKKNTLSSSLSQRWSNSCAPFSKDITSLRRQTWQ